MPAPRDIENYHRVNVTGVGEPLYFPKTMSWDEIKGVLDKTDFSELPQSAAPTTPKPATAGDKIAAKLPQGTPVHSGPYAGAYEQWGISNSKPALVASPSPSSGSAATDFARGVGASVLSTVAGTQDVIALGAARLAQAFPGFKEQDYQDVARRLAESRLVPNGQGGVSDIGEAPDSLSGKAGAIVGTGLQMAVPGGRVATALKGASLPARMTAEGGLGALLGLVQSSGDPTATVLGGLGGAAGYGLIRSGSRLWQVLKNPKAREVFGKAVADAAAETTVGKVVKGGVNAVKTAKEMDVAAAPPRTAPKPTVETSSPAPNVETSPDPLKAAQVAAANAREQLALAKAKAIEQKAAREAAEFERKAAERAARATRQRTAPVTPEPQSAPKVNSAPTPPPEIQRVTETPTPAAAPKMTREETEQALKEMMTGQKGPGVVTLGAEETAAKAAKQAKIGEDMAMGNRDLKIPDILAVLKRRGLTAEHVAAFEEAHWKLLGREAGDLGGVANPTVPSTETRARVLAALRGAEPPPVAAAVEAPKPATAADKLKAKRTRKPKE